MRIELSARGLSPGDHAIHFHQKAQCQGPDFKSAGDHFAPSAKTHGFDASGGPHAGDMPNLKVGQDGSVQVEIINTEVRLHPGKNSLLGNGGTALVIHAKADDYKSQPAGAAGDRLVCGKVVAQRE